MAFTTGTATSFDLTTGVKLDVENMIWLFSPFDVPLQGTMGSDGRSAISTDTVFETKYEWLDEALLTPRSALAQTAATSDNYVLLTAGDQPKFQTNDVVVLDSEYLLVTGYGTTADTLLVTRAIAGSQVQHVNLDVVVGVGSAPVEGSDPQNARAIDRNDKFNYTQIFGPYAVQVSGTEQSVQKYGLTGTEFDHQVANRTKEMFIAREQAILYGTRYNNTGTKQRTAGGLSYFIASNIDSATTLLTESVVIVQLQACFDAGGSPDRIVTGSKQKRVFSGVNENQIRYVQDTNIRGQKVDYYDSDFGRQLVVLDRWCRVSDMFIFSRDQATLGVLRPAQMEMLAKTGDSVKGQVLAESGLYFRRQQWAAMLTALT
jgi:hypothetical protein